MPLAKPTALPRRGRAVWALVRKLCVCFMPLARLAMSQRPRGPASCCRPAAGSLGLTLAVELRADEGAVGVGCGGDPNRALASVSLYCWVLAYGMHGRDRGHRQGGPGATVRAVHTTGVGVTAGGDPNCPAVRGMDWPRLRGSHRGVGGYSCR